MNSQKPRIVVNLAHSSPEEIFRMAQMLMKVAKSLQPVSKVLTIRPVPKSNLLKS